MYSPNVDIHPSGFGRSVAIVIGINGYAHGIEPLHNAVRDAEAIGDTLERQGFEVHRLLDEEATLDALSHLVSHRLPSLEPTPDRLLIYFAGHGLAHTDAHHDFSGHLLPVDARRDDPRSYWSMEALNEALEHFSCQHLLLILDCCFAGAFPRLSFRDLRPPEELLLPLYLQRFLHFTSHRSFQLLVSTAHDELASDRLHARPAQESLGDGLHSPFAFALLEALAPDSPADTNQDGLLTVTELYTRLRDKLIDLLPGNARQSPSLWNLHWHEGGEFLFLLQDSFPTLPSAPSLSKDGNPYLGLRPFSAEHRHLFFGRERLVDELQERLSTKPLLLLRGPSGIGKSSIVHAGLLPRLTEDTRWRIPPTLRPSTRPLEALACWLASLTDEAPTEAELSDRPQLAADCLRTFLTRHASCTALLVVDPLEELVTACRDESPRKDFLAALLSLLQLPGFRLLLLLRSDFEPHFSSLLQQTSLSPSPWDDARVTLPAMNRDELRRCIEKPAESRVLFFAPGVVEQLLDDVEQMPGALPLLSVALSELFDAYLESGRNDRTLSHTEYTRLGGGIAGALQRRAELVFSGNALPALDGPPLQAVAEQEHCSYQGTLRNVLLRMVSLEGGEPTRRRVPRAELEYPQPEENERVRRALSALEHSRLVTSQASEHEPPSVEPAHDALLRAWPKLQSWSQEARSELLLLRRVTLAADDWLHHARSEQYLWADERLNQSGLPSESSYREKRPLELTITSPGTQPPPPLVFNAIETEFLRASAQLRRAQLRRRQALRAGAVTTVIIFAVVVSLLALRASRQRDLAQASARVTRADNLLGQDPTRALLVFREALRMPDALPGNWLQTALDISRSAISSALLLGDERGKTVRSAAFSPDGARVLTLSVSGVVRLWNSDGTGSPLNLGGQDLQEAMGATFDRDGSRVLAGYKDGRALLWRSDGAGLPIALTGHTHRLWAVAFSADGSRAITGSEDGTARLWPLEGGGEPVTLDGYKGLPRRPAFSPDGSRVLTFSPDGTARITRTSGELPPVLLQTCESPVRFATFSPDGERLLLVHPEGAVHLWRTDGLTPPRPLANEREVTAAAFSRDGSLLLLGSNDGAARLWHTEEERPPLEFTGHLQAINSASFSPDGSLLLTSSDDGTARVWRTDDPGTSILLAGHTKRVESAAFSPDGAHLVTASEDSTARLWRLDAPSLPALLDYRRKVSIHAVSPDGARLLTTTDNGGTAHVWNADGSGAPLVLAAHERKLTAASFSPDGTRVLTASLEGTACLWSASEAGPPDCFEGYREPIVSATFSPDGTRVLLVLANGAVLLWSPREGGRPVDLMGSDDRALSATFSPDGTRILTLLDNGTARLWPANARGDSTPLLGHRRVVRSATFSPDGTRILTTSDDLTARLWNENGSTTPVSLPLDSAGEGAATFSPDGSLLLTHSRDGTLRLWHVNGGELARELRGHTRAVTSATFSPDGGYILTASEDETARLWRTDGSAPPIILPESGGAVRHASFTRDDSHTPIILTVSSDGTARLWRVDERRTTIVLPEEGVASASFLPGGARVVTLSAEGHLRIWPVTPQAMLGFMQRATTACLSASERELHLLESPAEASRGEEACEQAHGRRP